MFDGVDYAALGHLHGAQRLTDRVRYSGSPLPYSFSEEHHRKAMLLVDLGTPLRALAVQRLDRAHPGAAPARPGHAAGWTTC